MVEIQTDKHPPTWQDGLHLKLFRDIAILAIAYFVGGYIGISLAVPPGYATIVWPASGIALCALLMRGRWLWPGIWLGSFLLNATNGFDSSTALGDNWRVFAIASVLGVGASLQALAGLSMARRFADGIELSNFQRLAITLLLVVILPCVIAPTMGVSTLAIVGAIDSSMVLGNWLTWYFGDLLGVILVLPILLLSNRSPVDVRWQARSLQGASALVAISLAATLLLTFYVWQFLYEREYDQAEANLATMAANTDKALRHRLQIYQRALEGGAAFVTVNGGATPSQWREYTARLDMERAYPGMRGFGLFEEVADDDLPAFKKRFRA